MVMDWMRNRYTADYKQKYADLTAGVNRLYNALGIVRDVPNVPATRRYDLDSGKVINLRGDK